MPNRIEETSSARINTRDDDHTRGLATAPVTLIEYGDFECPHCGQAHEVLTELLEEHPKEVRLIYRHFPLMQIHPRALPAALAAEAAGAQGMFWEMHDLLFENQDALDDQSLAAYAQTIGLDPQRFAADLRRSDHANRIRRDIESGLASGVKGTPSFFINGQRHQGAWDLDSLAAAISRVAVE